MEGGVPRVRSFGMASNSTRVTIGLMVGVLPSGVLVTTEVCVRGGRYYRMLTFALKMKAAVRAVYISY